VILNVFFDKEWHHYESQGSIASVISGIVGGGGAGFVTEKRRGANAGAWFGFSDFRVDETGMPDNFLRVAVNGETGYGGLTWGVTDKHPMASGVWVSNNPNPPEFDPRVISDPGCPLFYEPRSTLPLSLVRAAVEEFCYTGTGTRPLCIGWVRSNVNGRRLDSKLKVEIIEDIDPWA
jgi:hypothetical protein